MSAKAVNRTLNKVTVRKSVEVPLRGAKAKFISFHGLCDSAEHVALDFGHNELSPPLVRIHSECLTGDVFHSSRCDCGEQLQEAVKRFSVSGGIILYLRQEGRGIGLYNKLDAYDLQLKGMDTYEANEALGLKQDARSYEAAAEMLKAMGILRIQLLSNNPLKAEGLRSFGIEVIEQVPTGAYIKKENLSYLKAKVKTTAHSINILGKLKIPLEA